LTFPDDLKIAEQTEDWEEQIALEQGASFSIPLKVEEFRHSTFEIVRKIDSLKIGATTVTIRSPAPASIPSICSPPRDSQRFR